MPHHQQSADQTLEILELLKESYLAELPERLDRIERQFIELEKPGDLPARFAMVFRELHNLKGSAGTFGLPLVSRVAHAVEDEVSRIDLAGAGLPPDLVDRGLGYVDVLRKAASHAAGRGPSSAEIEASLAAHQRPSPAGAPLEVVLLESSRAAAQVIMGLLRQRHLRVTVLTDGYEALGRLLHVPCHVLVTGVEIPTLGGLGLLAALRLAGGINRHVEGIVVTANEGQALPEHLQPCVQVLRNEFFRERFSEALVRVTSRKR